MIQKIENNLEEGTKIQELKLDHWSLEKIKVDFELNDHSSDDLWKGEIENIMITLIL